MERRDLHNASLNVVGEGLWGLQVGMIASATVLTVLLRKLGAGETQIGLIPAMEGGLTVLPQLAGVYLFANRRNRRRSLVIWHWAAVIPFLFVNALLVWAAPRLTATAVRWGLLASFACFNLTIGVIVSVWLDWLAHLFHTGIRGTVMGVSFCSSAFLGVGGSLLAGRLLYRSPDTTTYALLYGLSGIIALVSLACFWFVQDPAEQEREDTVRPRTRDLLERFRTSLAQQNFRAFLVGRLLAVAGFCILPFVAVYYQSVAGGGLSAPAIVTSGAALTFGTALAHLALGRLGDRHGHRWGVLIGATAQVAALVAMLSLPGQWGCLLTYFLAGVCASAGFLSHSNMVIETCPHDHRLAHITVANLVLAIPLLTFPALSGVIAKAWGLQRLFTLSLVLSALAFLWCLTRVKDPRDVDLLEAAPRV